MSKRLSIITEKQSAVTPKQHFSKLQRVIQLKFCLCCSQLWASVIPKVALNQRVIYVFHGDSCLPQLLL